MAVDAVAELMSYLQTNWDSSNTDSKTPTFQKLYKNQTKSLGLGTRNGDLVTFYQTTSPKRSSGIDSTVVYHESNISIDVHCYIDETHAMKVRDEVYRLLQTLRSVGTTSFRHLDHAWNEVDHSSKAVGYFRYTISVKLFTYRRDYT